MGAHSQSKGRQAEALVMDFLASKGCKVLQQQQRSFTTRAGKRVYPQPQGCDLVGTDPKGRALFVEVKAYSGKSIPISQKRGLTLRQLAFLNDMEQTGASALVAYVTDSGGMLFVPPHRIIARKSTHYTMVWAKEDAVVTVGIDF